MDNLVGCALMPHPPLMIPEVGKSELNTIKTTVDAANQVAEMLKQSNPQTVVIITPHGPVFEDAVTVSVHPRLRGSMANFGAPDVTLAFETDNLLIKNISRSCERLGINLMELTDDTAKNYRISLNLDHGAFVPLYYLAKAGFKGQIVLLSMGMLAYEEMYTFGKAVQTAIGNMDKRIAVIASGDLSHRLTPDAPAGYNPKGSEFDMQVVEALKKADVKALLNMDKKLIDEAGECGLRPIFFLMGVMGGLDVEVSNASYEGPFGVGYAVVSYKINGKK
ncbi:MAG: 3,4-dihydroxyphenylacetate 2,3-dioxygenase [Sporomusa sp.]|jgi:aromatic ring-opening dioxygenase LigB subunit|nr:3,4-dihydroxyphenylacetate 2,3-dioxygenase [Sporomusa sp.]